MSDTMEPIEWQCHLCTWNNLGTDRCSMCTIDRDVTLENMNLNKNNQNEDDVNADLLELRTTFENYLKLVELDSSDLITSLDNFQCPICLSTCLPGEGITLKDCLHTYCRECLAQAIEHSTEPEIRCPFRDSDYMCSGILEEREIKALVSPEVYAKFLARSVTEAEGKIQNAFHCKTVNCKGWCILDDEEDLIGFHCPICQKQNCIKCKAIHPNMTCANYHLSLKQSESEQASATHLKKLLESKEAMNCPTCKIMITKTYGCDGMTCSICKTAICWATRGPRWGPKGRGDISGGCRCGVNGKKCHPLCGFCH